MHPFELQKFTKVNTKTVKQGNGLYYNSRKSKQVYNNTKKVDVPVKKYDTTIPKEIHKKTPEKNTIPPEIPATKKIDSLKNAAELSTKLGKGFRIF